MEVPKFVSVSGHTFIADFSTCNWHVYRESLARVTRWFQPILVLFLIYNSFFGHDVIHGSDYIWVEINTVNTSLNKQNTRHGFSNSTNWCEFSQMGFPGGWCPRKEVFLLMWLGNTHLASTTVTEYVQDTLLECSHLLPHLLPKVTLGGWWHYSISQVNLASDIIGSDLSQLVWLLLVSSLLSLLLFSFLFFFLFILLFLPLPPCSSFNYLLHICIYILFFLIRECKENTKGRDSAMTIYNFLKIAHIFDNQAEVFMKLCNICC